MNSELWLIILSVVGSIISLLLVVIAFFLKKWLEKLDRVVDTVTSLNLTMNTYITKHDNLEKLIDADRENSKEFKQYMYDEVKNLRDFKHKHESDYANTIALLSNFEKQLEKVSQ